MELEVWSRGDAPAIVHPAPGFAASVPSDRVAARIDAVLDAGGWVVAALVAGELVGYASVLPPRPVEWSGQTIKRRWDDMDGVLELGALEVARPFRRSGLGRVIATELGVNPRLRCAVTFGLVDDGPQKVFAVDKPPTKQTPSRAAWRIRSRTGWPRCSLF